MTWALGQTRRSSAASNPTCPPPAAHWGRCASAARAARRRCCWGRVKGRGRQEGSIVRLGGLRLDFGWVGFGLEWACVAWLAACWYCAGWAAV